MRKSFHTPDGSADKDGARAPHIYAKLTDTLNLPLPRFTFAGIAAAAGESALVRQLVQVRSARALCIILRIAVLYRRVTQIHAQLTCLYTHGVFSKQTIVCLDLIRIFCGFMENHRVKSEEPRYWFFFIVATSYY